MELVVRTTPFFFWIQGFNIFAPFTSSFLETARTEASPRREGCFSSFFTSFFFRIPNSNLISLPKALSAAVASFTPLFFFA